MTLTAIAVDDATVIRESLPIMLPQLTFVGSYATVEQMLQESRSADVVILDLHLVNDHQPSVSQGVAAIRSVVAAGYRVCVYSQEERRFVLAACIAAGASGIVSKSSALPTARERFLDVASGRVVVPQPIISLMEVLVRRNCLTILSERQRQVLAGRARGFTYAELSSKLFLSESTLRGYWRDLAHQVTHYLQHTTPTDIEHALGLTPGDLLDFWPTSLASHPDQAEPAPEKNWWRLR
jgi:DNA-binding NarL/FixJ family response regulator